MPVACLLAVIVLSVSIFLHPVGNSDIFWQIRTGQLILETGSIPESDPFSFTKEGSQWIGREWLSGLVFHLVDSSWGFAGLSMFSLLLGLVLAGVLFAGFMAVSASMLRALVCCGAFLFFSAFRLQLLRPEVFGFLFFAIFLLIFLKIKKPGPLELAALFVIEVAWANMHASAILGPVVAFLLLPEIRRKLIFTAILFAALCVTPFGLEAVLFPVKHLLSGFTMGNVSDWRSPSLSLSRVDFSVIGAISMAIGAAGAMIRTRRIELGLAILSAAMLAAGIYSARFLPFAIMSLLFMICVLTGKDEDIKKHKSPFAVFAILAGASALAYFCGVPYSAAIDDGRIYFEKGRRGGLGIDESMFPSDAVTFVEKNISDIRMLNDMAYGGYFIYRFWPTRKVFIDTRTEVYGDAFIKEYSEALFDESAFDRIANKYKVSHVIYDARQISAEGGPLKFMMDKDGWGVAFESPVAIVFEKNGIR